MSLTLPPRPDFTQLKHQAKDLLRAHERKDPAACDVLHRLRRFADAADAEILAQPLQLHEAQYALAMEYGFTSWTEMKKHVDSVSETSEVSVRSLEGVGEIFEHALKELCDTYWQPRSYVYCRLVCMKAAGWNDVDYETLMPLSGYGISFVYHPNEKFWAHYSTPPGGDPLIAEATGFGWEWLHFDAPEAYWNALKETLDAGKAIHAPWWEEVIFYGYEEAEERQRRKVYPLAIGPIDIRAGQSWTWKEFETWFHEHSHGYLGRHTKKLQVHPPREVALKVMRNIVTFAEEDPRAHNEASTGVRYGLDGIKAYADDVADVSKSGKKDEYFQAGWLGCHNIYPQWTARRLTGMYLIKAAEHFTEPTRGFMLEAARNYQAAHAAWKEWEKYLGAYGLVKRPEDAWEKPKYRKSGAAAIFKALACERTAIGVIKKALQE